MILLLKSHHSSVPWLPPTIIAPSVARSAATANPTIDPPEATPLISRASAVAGHPNRTLCFGEQLSGVSRASLETYLELHNNRPLFNSKNIVFQGQFPILSAFSMGTSGKRWHLYCIYIAFKLHLNCNPQYPRPGSAENTRPPVRYARL